MALLLRELFAGFGLECFPKSSGSKGMQVYVPLNSEATYETTKPYARALAQALESSEPELVVSQMTKEPAQGQGVRRLEPEHASKTTVAVYSLRARERPTASTPLSWDEVRRASNARIPTASASRPTRCWSGSTSTVTCSHPCSSSSRSCRTGSSELAPAAERVA